MDSVVFFSIHLLRCRLRPNHTLAPTLKTYLQVYDYYLTVDVDNVGEELLSIPLKADCQVTPLVSKQTLIDL